MQMPTHIVATAGVVEDGNGNVLLVKTIHGGWVFPGGQVEVGENIADALCREIKEESGIDAVVSHMIGVYSNTGTQIWYDGVTHVPTKVMLDFVCKFVGGELCISEETTDSRWVPRHEALDYISAPAIRTRYQAYLDFQGDVHLMEYVTKPVFELKQTRTV